MKCVAGRQACLGSVKHFTGCSGLYGKICEIFNRLVGLFERISDIFDRICRLVWEDQ